MLLFELLLSAIKMGKIAGERSTELHISTNFFLKVFTTACPPSLESIQQFLFSTAIDMQSHEVDPLLGFRRTSR